MSNTLGMKTGHISTHFKNADILASDGYIYRDKNIRRQTKQRGVLNLKKRVFK